MKEIHCYKAVPPLRAQAPDPVLEKQIASLARLKAMTELVLGSNLARVEPEMLPVGKVPEKLPP